MRSSSVRPPQPRIPRDSKSLNAASSRGPPSAASIVRTNSSGPNSELRARCAKSAPAEQSWIRFPSKSKNAATFGPPGPVLMRSMSSSTVITGGVVPVISFSLRLPLSRAHCLGDHKPGPDTTRRVLELSGRKGTPQGCRGRWLAAVPWLRPSHYEESIRLGQECQGEIPLLRGRELPDVVTRWRGSLGHTQQHRVRRSRSLIVGSTRGVPRKHRSEAVIPPGVLTPSQTPIEKGPADADLSRGGAGRGRAVHTSRGRPSRAGTR